MALKKILPILIINYADCWNGTWFSDKINGRLSSSFYNYVFFKAKKILALLSINTIGSFNFIKIIYHKDVTSHYIPYYKRSVF